MSISFKAKSFGTMFHDVTQAERDKVYDIRHLERESGKFKASLSTDDIDGLVARGATAVLEASIGAGRSSTVTRTLLSVSAPRRSRATSTSSSRSMTRRSRN